MMIIRMLNGTREDQPERKNDRAAMSTLQGINSRSGEVEDQIRELEHRVEKKITKLESQKVNQNKNN